MPPTRFAPFAGPDTTRVRTPVLREGAADPPAEDDYPPIEQFIDEFPSIDDYLAVDTSAEETVAEDYVLEPAPEEQTPVASVTGAAVTAEAPPVAEGTDGWGAAGWQAYDWNAVASLGHVPIEHDEALKAWDAGNWPDSGSAATRSVGDSLSVSAGGGTSSEDVARALDDIAQRIRSGQLPLDQIRGTPPEAAMAAALAAMLRSRGV